MIDRQDATEILVWLGTAFLVLALLNGLTEIVPLEKPAQAEYVMNTRRR